MTNEKIYFTEVEALESIKEVLESGYDGYACDLHNEVFNMDYYIIGTYKAKQALEQYGVFEAIETIQEYEKENFGEVQTDLSNPEEISNMLWYIIGEKAFHSLDGNTLDKYWDDMLGEEQADKIIDDIERQLDKLKRF